MFVCASLILNLFAKSGPNGVEQLRVATAVLRLWPAHPLTFGHLYERIVEIVTALHNLNAHTAAVCDEAEFSFALTQWNSFLHH